MNEDTLYTRGEFLKVGGLALAAVLFGGLFAGLKSGTSLLKTADAHAYGNSTYGGKVA
ncbi:hypothetical protein [Rhodoplanes elegans]|uniref:hypothetical protein n=1 Tax=Rhodoplanes elegans TaxID=29408 RepID=UPI001914BE8B|nr:hypothetical protein [Rhodoplanes elegans]